LPYPVSTEGGSKDGRPGHIRYPETTVKREKRPQRTPAIPTTIAGDRQVRTTGPEKKKGERKKGQPKGLLIACPKKSGMAPSPINWKKKKGEGISRRCGQKKKNNSDILTKGKKKKKKEKKRLSTSPPRSVEKLFGKGKRELFRISMVEIVQEKKGKKRGEKKKKHMAITTL